ncbi:hypothetical protein JW698_02405 [Candidatus Wolfebacteria bacterium]|nr:hypothetical protein [Candidatus Wolfebacteria bacterium]
MSITIQEKQIEEIVEKVVFKILKRALSDPDFGLEINPEFEKKFKKSINSRKKYHLKDFKNITDSL